MARASREPSHELPTVPHRSLVMSSEIIQDFTSNQLTEHALIWLPGMHDWRQILTQHPTLTHMLMHWRSFSGWNGSVSHHEVTKIYGLMQLAKIPADDCNRLVECQERSSTDDTLEVSRQPPNSARTRSRVDPTSASVGSPSARTDTGAAAAQDLQASADSATPEQVADLAAASEHHLPLGSSPPLPTWLPPTPISPPEPVHVSKPSFFRPTPGSGPTSPRVLPPPPPPPSPTRRAGESRRGTSAGGRPECILFFLGRQSDAAWDPKSQRGFLDGATVSAQTAAAIAKLGYRVVVAGHIVGGKRGQVHFVHEDKLRLVSPPANRRELLSGLPEWLADVPPGEPLFDHVVIVRFVAQFTLRFQVCINEQKWPCCSFAPSRGLVPVAWAPHASPIP